MAIRLQIIIHLNVLNVTMSLVCKFCSCQLSMRGIIDTLDKHYFSLQQPLLIISIFLDGRSATFLAEILNEQAGQALCSIEGDINL